MRRWLCLVALAGCTIPRSEFVGEKADALCALERRCAVGAFYEEYTGMEQCLTRAAVDVEDEIAGTDVCAYRPAEAARCVSRLRSLPCADFARDELEEPCDLVFDCGFAQ